MGAVIHFMCKLGQEKLSCVDEFVIFLFVDFFSSFIKNTRRKNEIQKLMHMKKRILFTLYPAGHSSGIVKSVYLIIFIR